MSEKVINNLNIKNKTRKDFGMENGLAVSAQESCFSRGAAFQAVKSLCYLKVLMLWRKLLKVFILNFWELHHFCSSR